VDERVWIAVPQMIEIRLARVRDGVEVGIFSIAEAIQDKQQDGCYCRSRTVGHAGFFFLKQSK
jgi:hypothetical protein